MIYLFVYNKNNARYIKLCTKTCTKFYEAIHMVMGSNTHGKSY